ncbi:MAG TPA: hypothetical protein PLL71_17765 [Agriterribacter sp.]|nr:hypothetical protein [Agriterribacter sp.]HRQ51662.1 hypothetical protein [Agriterribacter sp.]
MDKYFICITGFTFVFSSHVIEKNIWLFAQSFLIVVQRRAADAVMRAGKGTGDASACCFLQGCTGGRESVAHQKKCCLCNAQAY